MYQKEVLIRFGDLTLKGKNQKMFATKLKKEIKDKLKDLNCKINNKYNRVYIELNETNFKEVEKRLLRIPGISSFSFVYKTDLTIEEISNTAVMLLNNEFNFNNSFKIETKRANKNLPYTSQEFSKIISGIILSKLNKKVKIDVNNPDNTLNIELRDEYSYLYLTKIKGLGGYPIGTGGKALVMLSGGIDSPVSAFLALTRGIEIELLHFESSPLTPLESIDKVIEISQELAKYMPNNKIKLHLVPFTEIHKNLLLHIPESYNITIMRRMMYRIAEKFAKKKEILALVNGESIGQVASQTLESINVVENVTKIPIIRPLCTYDKEDIIKLSKFINTYNTSILPFEDCCTVYVPKRPVIKPKLSLCKEYEKKFSYLKLVNKAVKNIETITINYKDRLDLHKYGFDFKDSYKNYLKDKDNK